MDWTDLNGVHHTDPLDIKLHCFNPTKTQVLNPAAWTNVPDGQFAANQSSIGSFHDFRILLENANFSRSFQIREHYSLNIRVEFTNIFNRLQIPTTATAPGGINLGNFAQAPTKFTSGYRVPGASFCFPIGVSAAARWAWTYSCSLRRNPLSASSGRELNPGRLNGCCGLEGCDAKSRLFKGARDRHGKIGLLDGPYWDPSRKRGPALGGVALPVLQSLVVENDFDYDWACVFDEFSDAVSACLAARAQLSVQGHPDLNRPV